MSQTIGYITLVVRDYDETIAFFTGSLGFDLIEDTPSKDPKAVINAGSWLLLAVPAERRSSSPRPLHMKKRLASATKPAGRVFLFLHTDDFWRDYNAIREKGVKFIREPKEEEYGTVAVFEDLYGNKWDLLELTPCHPGGRVVCVPKDTGIN
jgi:catechol 2,3-dioxygenase-like lactoylglutathione lyase family enzyme